MLKLEIAHGVDAGNVLRVWRTASRTNGRCTLPETGADLQNSTGSRTDRAIASIRQSCARKRPWGETLVVHDHRNLAERRCSSDGPVNGCWPNCARDMQLPPLLASRDSWLHLKDPLDGKREKENFRNSRDDVVYC